MAEKEVKLASRSVLCCVNVETYYGLRYSIVKPRQADRRRLCGMVCALRAGGQTTYQHNSRSSVPELSALNVIPRGCLETGIPG
jgi:hypothetical protein